MEIRVADFTIKPVMCPRGMEDCSPCRWASKMTVRNPSISSGKGLPNFGSVQCGYLDWFHKEYEKKVKGD